MFQYCWATLARQRMQPDRFLLYLSEAEFASEVQEVRAQLRQWGDDERLDIRLVEDIGSYKKLIPAMEEVVTDALIVTVDDDVLYHPEFLSRLRAASCAYPSHIVCGHGRHIRRNFFGRYLNYRLWPALPRQAEGIDVLPVGVGGVAYRSSLLDLEFLLDRSFLRFAPRADDFWFKLAAVKRGTSTFCDPGIFTGSMPIMHELSLTAGNNTESVNQRTPLSKFWSLTKRELQDYLGLNRTPNDEQWDGSLLRAGGASGFYQGSLEKLPLNAGATTRQL